MLVFLLVFELGEVGVVVEFLLVYPVELYFWEGIPVCNPSRFSILVPISLSLMCLVMADLQFYVW